MELTAAAGTPGTKDYYNFTISVDPLHLCGGEKLGMMYDRNGVLQDYNTSAYKAELDAAGFDGARSMVEKNLNDLWPVIDKANEDPCGLAPSSVAKRADPAPRSTLGLVLLRFTFATAIFGGVWGISAGFELAQERGTPIPWGLPGAVSSLYVVLLIDLFVWLRELKSANNNEMLVVSALNAIIRMSGELVYDVKEQYCKMSRQYSWDDIRQAVRTMSWTGSAEMHTMTTPQIALTQTGTAGTCEHV